MIVYTQPPEAPQSRQHPTALGFALPTLPPPLNWWIVGGVGLVLFMWWFSGRRGRKTEMQKLEADYRRRRQEISEKYSTGGRLRRAGRRARSVVPRVSWGS